MANITETPPESKITSEGAASFTIAGLNEFSKYLTDSDDDSDDSIITAVTSQGTPYDSAKRFEDLNLSPKLLRNLYGAMKFKRPSKFQAISLPMILTPPFKNLIAQAHNGSGKTACFILGMLSRVDPKLTAPQALCICPTRELAVLNRVVLLKMGRSTGITSALAIPAYESSSDRLSITEQVVFGTPGTISKLIIKGKLSMGFMKILVFDEADNMLAESGFEDHSVKIMRSIVQSSPDCQVLLFSAKFDDAVGAFVDKINKDIFNKDYNQMFVKKEELSLESVKQYKVQCPDELAKLMVVKDKILELGEKVGQTIIFVQTRNSASALHQGLVKLGYEVTTIQATLNQEDRDKMIKAFKEGLTQILISTNVLTQEFDQSQVNLVVNYELPVNHKDKNVPELEPDYKVYLRRVGRAIRFGRKGAVFNLLCGDRDKKLMEKIEKYFNCQITQVGSRNSDEDFEDALKKAGLM